MFQEDLINYSPNFDEITNDTSKIFLEEKWADFSDFNDTLNEIRKMEIKIKNRKVTKLYIYIYKTIYIYIYIYI